ncbi:hypothetical protein [Kineococcus radiotolerans]|uniref:hypothetical protein n=1 Tax=Kineococcus radiotolerans TaxID=131568 RepID=UPI00003A3E30|nr:hypothetical protein [Kineococcus radiotolerans]
MAAGLLLSVSAPTAIVSTASMVTADMTTIDETTVPAVVTLITIVLVVIVVIVVIVVDCRRDGHDIAPAPPLQGAPGSGVWGPC